MKSFKEIWKAVIQKPGSAPHSEKWDRCVADVKSKNPKANAYAVCTAQLGEESFKSQEEIDKMGIEAAGPIPKSGLAAQDLEGETTDEKVEAIRDAQLRGQKKEIAARKSFKQVYKDSFSAMEEEEEDGAERYEEIAETFESMANDEKKHARELRDMRNKTQTFKNVWANIKPRK